MSKQNFLTEILKNPPLMAELDIEGWNEVLFDAYMLKLRGRLAHPWIVGQISGQGSADIDKCHHRSHRPTTKNHVGG